MTMEGRRDYKMERKLIDAILQLLKSEGVIDTTTWNKEQLEKEDTIHAAAFRASLIVSQAVIMNR